MPLPRNAVRAVLLALVALLASGCERVLFRYLNRGLAPPAESAVFDAGHGLAPDVYRAQGAAPGKAPVVVFFYGGAWQRGERAQYRFVGRRLAANGILAIVADYRTWPRAGFPDFVGDAADAVAWARRHAAGYGGDPARLFVMADDLVDHEADEGFAELGVELGVDGEGAQAFDLTRLAARVAGGEAGLRLVLADRLGDAEPLRQHVDQRGVDVVDALAVGREHRIGLLGLRFAGHMPRTLARNPRLPSARPIAICPA